MYRLFARASPSRRGRRRCARRTGWRAGRSRLLARRPRRARPEPEALVEGARPRDDVAAQEDRERDHRGSRRFRGVERPRWPRHGGSAVPSGSTARPREHAERRRRRRSARRRARGVGRVDAVVVRERHEIGLELGERRVPRPGEPARRAKAETSSGGCARAAPATRSSGFWSTTTRRKAVWVWLRASRGAASSGVGPVDGRHDEVEAGSRAAPATGAGYPPPCSEPRLRVRRPCRPRRPRRRSARR